MSRFPLDFSGLWREVRSGRPAEPGPALFLDRDGTLIRLVNYLSRAEDVAPIPGAFETLAQARRAGFRAVIVTNQSGIERGCYGWAAFAAVQARVIALAEAAGGAIDAVYACPALPGSGAACRKPAPGMILAAAEDLAIDLGASWIVGDSASDLEAGRRAGLRRGWLVPTGRGAGDRGAAVGLACGSFRVTIGRPIAALAAERAGGVQGAP